MPHPPVTQIFLIILFFFIQVMCMSISNKNVALIQQVCQKTHNYSVCVSSLKSDPRSLNADLKDLVVIMMDVALVKAVEISELIDKLNNKASDIRIKSCFNVCSADYGVAIDDLQRAIHAFELGTYEESYGFVGHVAVTPGWCEDTFSEPQTQRKSPLTATNALFASMATVAVDILSIFIKHKSP